MNLEIIWNALCTYREECIPNSDEDWDEICSVMAKIEENLDPDEWVGLTSQVGELT
jgi:hypothetical protein